MSIVEWFVRLVRTAAFWAWFTDWRHANTPISGSSGPAVGQRSKRAWSLLVLLGRWDFYLTVATVIGIMVAMLYFA